MKGSARIRAVKREARLLGLRCCGWLLRRLARSAAAAPSGPLSVLLIRPDHLGDVLLSRPAIEALARALPQAHLSIAVGPWGRPALGPIPANRDVLICPFPGFSRKAIGPLRPYLLLARYALQWRGRRRYGMALILRPDHWWGALLAMLLGVPVRIGYDTPETRPFLTVALPRAPGTHAAAEALILAAAAARCAGGGISRDAAEEQVLPTSVTSADHQQLTTLLREAGVAEGQRLLVLHPAAGSALKSWPVERFAAVGRELAATLLVRVVVTGSEIERPLARELCALLPEGTLNLAGYLTWGELEALLSRAALVIGVDSGPLHLAVAAGTPSVALFGPADPEQFGPWGSPARHRVVTADLPCRPCRRLDVCMLEPGGSGPPPCMRALTVDMVLTTARAALGEGRQCLEAIHQA